LAGKRIHNSKALFEASTGGDGVAVTAFASGEPPPIAMHATPFLPDLSPVATKLLTATRDAGNLSSNGGAVVLREAARRLGIVATIAGP
jgi:hypothetical protein